MENQDDKVCKNEYVQGYTYNILCTIFRCLGKEMKIHRDLFMMMLCVAG